MLGVGDLFGDEHVNGVSFMDINSNDGDNLSSEYRVKILSDSVNKVLDTNEDEVKVVFHCAFASTFELFKGSSRSLSPHHLSAK